MFITEANEIVANKNKTNFYNYLCSANLKLRRKNLHHCMLLQTNVVVI
jgi:hypothetical protein